MTARNPQTLDEHIAYIYEVLRRLRPVGAIDVITSTDVGGDENFRHDGIDVGAQPNIDFLDSADIVWSVVNDGGTAAIIISGAVNFPVVPTPTIRVKEVDGAPDALSVSVVRVNDGALTDDGGGQVTIDTRDRWARYVLFGFE